LPSVSSLLAKEESHGLHSLETYSVFQQQADRVKHELLTFLVEKKRAGKRIAAYGAAAKGNTLLNYAGVKKDLIAYVCDAAPSKQGKFLPGSRIPILASTALKEDKPNVVLVLPWNIADEIMQQHAYVRNWGGEFVVSVPRIEII